jgi:hypothetical protein
MTLVFIGYFVLDVIASIALILIARRNPTIRHRLISAFKLIVGQAYLTIHDPEEEARAAAIKSYQPAHCEHCDSENCQDNYESDEEDFEHNIN